MSDPKANSRALRDAMEKAHDDVRAFKRRVENAMLPPAPRNAMLPYPKRPGKPGRETRDGRPPG